MLRRLSLALLAFGLTLSHPSFAATPTGISQKVATCDPSYPNRCLKPAADGSIAVTGGGAGGNTTTTATAVAPTLTEGSTSNALSVNLKGENRSIISNGGVTATVTAGNALKVDGSAVTQPVSGTVTANIGTAGTLATAAKQPALGTAGTASTDVLTVQGITSMTPLAGNITQVAGASVATGHGTASGAIRVELPTDGTGVVNVGTISGSVTLPTNAATSTLQGVQGTGLNPPTGGSGEIGFLSGIYNQVISTAAQAVAPQAQTTGGCTPGVALSAASNNSTLISTGAHTLCKLTVINTTATVYYLRTYDASSAPTCSSATGVTGAYPIPASTTGAGVAVPIGPFGEAYASGLGYCITGASGLNDNTNAATGVTLNYSYK